MLEKENGLLATSGVLGLKALAKSSSPSSLSSIFEMKLIEGVDVLDCWRLK